MRRIWPMGSSRRVRTATRGRSIRWSWSFARVTTGTPAAGRAGTAASSSPRACGSIEVRDRAAARAARRARGHGAAARPANRGGTRLRTDRGSGSGAAGSALAPGGVAVRHARLRPHPRRHRPPAVPPLPRDPVSQAAAAPHRRDGVHAGALGNAHRLGARSRAGRALVSTARRNRDRRLDRLHGAREHRRIGARCGDIGG